ncbi:MAG: hypothetical protein GQ574_29125 [Crocinitomix sp.]|nr:hypothetical protein [Crocinitomix sp.]
MAVIHLNTFEEEIDPTILKRGLSYYSSGHVIDFVEITNNEYQATVAGTEDYSVSLKKKGDSIHEWNCTCPYDYGWVCKHVTAAIFHLLKDTLTIDISEVPKQKRRIEPVVMKKRTKSIKTQTKEILKQVPQNEMEEFIQQSLSKNREFRNAFLATFGHLSENNSPRALIQAILKRRIGNKPWIDRAQMTALVQDIEPFLKNARHHLQTAEYEKAFSIATALLEGIVKKISYCDDSGGDLGNIAWMSMHILQDLAKTKIPDEINQTLFNYCLTAFNKGVFGGWDWHIEVIELAGSVAKNKKDINRVLVSLKTLTNDYDRSKAVVIELDLLKRFGTQKDVDNLISNNLIHYEVREIAIIQAIENKTYEIAIGLCKDGIEQDRKDRPGYLKKWYDLLLRIAVLQEDIGFIISYSRHNFINSYENAEYYYELLKTYVPDDDWNPFLEELIAEINAAQNWRNMDRVRFICIKEEWWDKLLDYVKTNRSISLIEDSTQYLKADYRQDLIELYRVEILEYLDSNVGRNHYKTACRHLRKMKKLDAAAEVNALVEELRQKFPARYALIEELERV